MKKLVFVILSLSSAVCHAQEPSVEEKMAMTQYVPAGRGMARQAYIAAGQPMRKSTSGPFVYSKGPIQGLTKDQAFAKFESMWAASPASVRMNWAKKAMAAGVTVESQRADAAAADRSADESRKFQKDQENERRLRELEQAEQDRQNRER